MTVRDTPVTFTADEADLIRAAVRVSDRDVTCPRCHRRLQVGPTAAAAGRWIRQIWCPGCCRCAMLSA